MGVTSQTQDFLNKIGIVGQCPNVGVEKFHGKFGSWSRSTSNFRNRSLSVHPSLTSIGKKWLCVHIFRNYVCCILTKVCVCGLSLGTEQ